MIISKVEIYKLSIPMDPFVIATGVMDYAQNVFIRVHTDVGIVGMGECSAFPMIVGETQNTCYVLAQDFAALWKGKDPLAIKERLSELDHYIYGNSTIKSAFDMALYDIASKNAQLPLYRFLGGEYRSIVTDITVGIDDPLAMAEQALSFKRQGATILKVKLGKSKEEDVLRVRKIRELIGYDIPIRLDANQGWDFDTAAYVLKALESEGIAFCEQPMRTYNDYLLPDLLAQTSIPIMADESVYSARDADRLCRTQSCDYINIKFSKSGGIHEALDIAQTAERYGVPCMIGGMLESRLALTAKFHFALAANNVVFHDMDTCLLGHRLDPVTGGVGINTFELSLDPNVVGIGAGIDEQFLSTLERAEIG